jgi:glutathione S-transferase
MDLYFSPLACSLATRIAFYESGQSANFHQVTLSSKTLADGSDYRQVNPKGQVPALILDDGTVLTEGPAILQYVADQAPASSLAPAAGSLDRYSLQSWLNYISAEVHKQIFFTIFNPASPEAARDFARDVVAPAKYDYLSAHLADRDFLVGSEFTVADAYLAVSLNWAQPAGIDLSRWPVLTAYHGTMLQRPAVARAMADEVALLQ